MNAVHLSGLNVYDPTDENLLALIKADTIWWDCRGLGRFYKKISIEGPAEHDGRIVYHVNVGEPVEVKLPVMGMVVIN